MSPLTDLELPVGYRDEVPSWDHVAKDLAAGRGRC